VSSTTTGPTGQIGRWLPEMLSSLKDVSSHQIQVLSHVTALATSKRVSKNRVLSRDKSSLTTPVPISARYKLVSF